MNPWDLAETLTLPQRKVMQNDGYGRSDVQLRLEKMGLIEIAKCGHCGERIPSWREPIYITELGQAVLKATQHMEPSE